MLQISVAQIGATQDAATNAASVVATIRNLQPPETEHLVVFPECILTGYMFSSEEETIAHSIALDSPELGAVAEACKERGVYAVVGFLESRANATYNAAAMFDPAGHLMACYRKVHLPFLGADRFVTAGTEPPPVVDIPEGRIGIAICYDLRFPESARSLALAGADLVVQPSTMPNAAAILLEHFVPVRACENRIFFALANRGDEEAGVNFTGLSQILDPAGRRLAQAEPSGDQVLSAVVNLEEARIKSIVTEPGEYEVSLFKDRRPSTYSAITSATQE